MKDADARARYPRLFEPDETTWGHIHLRYVFEMGPPPPHLIGNVRFVGFKGDRVLAIRTREFGWSLLPGGTLEPGEPVADALHRELAEEAGARVLSFEVFAGMHFWSSAQEPYRPHLPHPEFYWVVGYGDVEITGSPTQPADGEHVLEVALLAMHEADAIFATHPEAWQLDVIRLAAEIRRGVQPSVPL